MTNQVTPGKNTFTQMFQNMVAKFLPSSIVFSLGGLGITAVLASQGHLTWEPAFLTYTLIPGLATLIVSAGLALYGLAWERKNLPAGTRP